MKTYISNNRVSLSDCTVKNIVNAVKGLELLNQTVTNITVRTYFDFDTKYYHRFDEKLINDIYVAFRYETKVILRNNRLYYNDIILPDSIINSAEIYFN